ncbi:two-component system, sporulation sensor kinase D [Parabacteroides sp. PF5-5]|uniref:sensor histidine kinase n=1 Tax=unclassified Parabacteroides TaxID=2649774 RepID=UPI002473CC47|nr:MULTISPECIES: HAMP domain-containing sensor histidine kinase [unclassified Parabacteroides]MDH6306604.1 two-component system, sporulation sensor kinase D [Parabacteroides sp. PH5-39]MDH6317571.1 two-component system, sporulation sensor kinase D [Parabacteroides sp. PF5-13]MDH6321315.1 two-component system, sporulation sensor kinase D [Parabacteroides sp. PH5-13]MDH6325120.1 two-component system, sporulation sensor kinase D [Parabacteroides sp. PH5-8]MDH6328829.1 two-component system, sporul
MSTIYESRQRLKYLLILGTLLIAIASVITSNILIKDLADEERQKMEVWGEANRVVTSQSEDEDYIRLILRILEGNTTIPVILCNENDSVIYFNNIKLPEVNQETFLLKKVKELKAKKTPFIIEIEDDVVQYLYYDDSIILKRLSIFPYAQLVTVFVFILIAFFALSSTKKAEQNKVWIGLSKETAHQLGTPISSLVAWIEYLRTKDMDPSLLNEMDKDVKRLETIADRFSKIGSNPDPTPVNINLSVLSALDYMKTRISSKVKLYTHLTEEPALVLMNESLFAWVIENLVKNAVDAMGGQGEITFQVAIRKKDIQIEIRDTGKGIHKSKFDTIFSPGYTTKARGWGLGLSLVKRIIESYHGGKIFVKNSELGKGTTFCIELRKYKG